MKTEPVLVILAGAAALIASGIAAANALDWTHLDANETAAVVGFVVVFGGVLAGAIRGQVWSPESHATELAKALGTTLPEVPNVDVGSVVVEAPAVVETEETDGRSS